MSKNKGIEKHLLTTKRSFNELLDRIASEAKAAGNARIMKLLDSSRGIVTANLLRLEKESMALITDYKNSIEEKTNSLKTEIQLLRRANDTVVSDNYLLEYKKKDLMLLADNLEEAYEEISKKNDELQKQKKQISEQTEKLQTAHEEILRKNEELESQKESILDQAEYLHDANQSISQMHMEVQKQKDEILKKNLELVDLNNEKNNLIGIVAHDLKSPLSQIKGLVTIMRLTATDFDEETLKYLTIIGQSADRLNEMIGKILDIEAIESQKLNIKPEQLNFTNVTKELVDRFKITANEKSITVKEDIADDVYALADKGFLNQVYENLISNAIKFSDRYTSLDIILTNKDGKALLEVKDEGPGISKEDQKKLFGKYQKLTARPTAGETSTGLGLSIVKQFVEAMNGRIWCESTIGKGASFFVEFDAITPSDKPE